MDTTKDLAIAILIALIVALLTISMFALLSQFFGDSVLVPITFFALVIPLAFAWTISIDLKYKKEKKKKRNSNENGKDVK